MTRHSLYAALTYKPKGRRFNPNKPKSITATPQQAKADSSAPQQNSTAVLKARYKAE